jgi:AcrR family transcriptional regulator
MSDSTTSRRARLRAETAAEIKTVALKHMATNGTAAVSLRAIARDMGMTAGAIYSYFDTRDTLITALINDVYGALADALEAARDAVPDEDVGGRIRAHGVAYRLWAVSHPEEFRLLYGDPVPDYQPPVGGAAADAEHRLCAALLELVAAAWPSATTAHAADRFEWSDLDSALSTFARESFPDLPPAAVALALRIWGRMHGLVALEVYGHLRAQVHDPAKLYRAEMADLTTAMGLPPA